MPQSSPLRKAICPSQLRLVVACFGLTATPSQAALPALGTAIGLSLAGLAALTTASALAAIYFWRTAKQRQANLSNIQRGLIQQQQLLKKFDSQVIASKTDLDLNITWVSEALLKISGYEAEDLLGQPVSKLLDPHLGYELYPEILTTIDKCGSWRGTVRHVGKGPKYYWVEALVEPLLDDEGERCGYIQIRQDITHQKRLEELWMTDHLTGLHNRQSVDQLWEREILRSTRYGDIFSVLLIDIDLFKRVNDEYGHLVGDEILFQFAQLLKQVSRDTDHIGRWGGEEFIVLIPNTNLSSAVLMAEKLRETIEQFKFSTVGSLTASIGLATYRNGMSQEELFRVADRALYQAKARGRNRVEVGDIRDHLDESIRLDSDKDSDSNREKEPESHTSQTAQLSLESANAQLNQQ